MRGLVQNGLFEIAAKFADLQFALLKEEGVAQFTSVPRMGDKEEHGHLFIEVHGSDALKAARGFLLAVDALGTGSTPEIRQKAAALLKPLLSAGEQLYGMPFFDQIGAATAESMKRGIPKTAAEANATVQKPQPVTPTRKGQKKK